MRTAIRAKDFELTDALRAQVERRVRLALTRFADQLDGVTVRIEQRIVRVEGDARYMCEIAMAPVRVQICEEYDRIETAIDRSARAAARLSRRHLPASGGRLISARRRLRPQVPARARVRGMPLIDVARRCSADAAWAPRALAVQQERT